MKNQFLLFAFILSFFFASPVKSQITISPEIGISYLPFTFYTLGDVRTSQRFNPKKPNLLFGLSAQIPIYKKWNGKLRISYTDRNDVNWVILRDDGPAPFEWKHQDLNIDFNLQYNLHKNIFIGVGPSLIRSFMELNQTPTDLGLVPAQQKINRFFFGLNSSISFVIKRVNINLMYLRTRRYNGRLEYLEPNGDNRIDFTIGYRIGKGK